MVMEALHIRMQENSSNHNQGNPGIAYDSVIGRCTIMKAKESVSQVRSKTYDDASFASFHVP